MCIWPQNNIKKFLKAVQYATIIKPNNMRKKNSRTAHLVLTIVKMHQGEKPWATVIYLNPLPQHNTFQNKQKFHRK